MEIAADTRLRIGIPDTKIDLRAVLLESGMGFLEVPALDRKHPSTSYSMRGRRLTVDLLTPMRGKPASRPVRIEALGVPAEQAQQLIDVLSQDRPGDLRLAWEASRAQAGKFRTQLNRGLKRLSNEQQQTLRDLT